MLVRRSASRSNDLQGQIKKIRNIDERDINCEEFVEFLLHVGLSIAGACSMQQAGSKASSSSRAGVQDCVVQKQGMQAHMCSSTDRLRWRSPSSSFSWENTSKSPSDVMGGVSCCTRGVEAEEGVLGREC